MMIHESCPTPWLWLVGFNSVVHQQNPSYFLFYFLFIQQQTICLPSQKKRNQDAKHTRVNERGMATTKKKESIKEAQINSMTIVPLFLKKKTIVPLVKESAELVINYLT
jgi:hypothetical protein